jgi:hypothetical protein
MKGMVFTEFLSFVTSQYGEDMVDDIIAASPLPSGGAYTSVGTYSHTEMVTLCTELAGRTQETVPNVVRRFGSYLSCTFAREYPSFFPNDGDFFSFLASIEKHIHVEVRKLYPDAELPTFTVQQRTPTGMVIDYESPRRMNDLAEGLILGSARVFGVDVRVQMIPMETDGKPISRFVIDLAR